MEWAPAREFPGVTGGTWRVYAPEPGRSGDSMVQCEVCQSLVLATLTVLCTDNKWRCATCAAKEGGK
jgi:hypothetical protein